MSLIQRMALLLGTTALIGACGGGEPAPPMPAHQADPAALEEPVPEGEPEAGGQLNLRLNGSPGTLNPLFFTSSVESRLMGLIFDNLWAADFDMEAQPLLVESYEQSEDRRTFVVHLKKEARWQDGERFTSVYSIPSHLTKRCGAVVFNAVNTCATLQFK